MNPSAGVGVWGDTPVSPVPVAADWKYPQPAGNPAAAAVRWGMVKVQVGVLEYTGIGKSKFNNNWQK